MRIHVAMSIIKSVTINVSTETRVHTFLRVLNWLSMKSMFFKQVREMFHLTQPNIIFCSKIECLHVAVGCYNHIYNTHYQ